MGTMEQIVVTPIKPLEFSLGKTMPSIVLGFVNMIFVTLISVFWFDIPRARQCTVSFVANGLYLMTTVGIVFDFYYFRYAAGHDVELFHRRRRFCCPLYVPIANMPEVVAQVYLCQSAALFLF